MSAKLINIDLSGLPEVTNAVFYPLYWCRERWLILMGGGASGKSFFANEKDFVRCVSEIGQRGERHRILVLRKVAATLRKSVWRLALDIINLWGWRGLLDGNPTMKTQELVLRFKNGAEIIFAGLDDPEKIKSIQGITSIRVEEATEFTEQDITQLNLRLRGITWTYMQLVLCFNPISVMHWLKKRFWDKPKANAKVVTTTYLDNRWCTDEDKKVYEELRETNPEMYAVYGLGQWGLLEGLIYGPPKVSAAADWPADEWFDEIIYGLDFGFNHPMALEKIGIKDKKRIFVQQLIHERGLTTSNVIERLPELIPDRQAPIYADSSRPDSIQEICDAGWNCKPANKGEGSVIAGINFVKSVDITLHEDGAETLKEFYAYSWAKDKEGNPLDKPVKVFDDGQDAIRYPLYTHLSEPVPAMETYDHDIEPEYA